MMQNIVRPLLATDGAMPLLYERGRFCNICHGLSSTTVLM
jgi:hypothetical protein